MGVASELSWSKKYNDRIGIKTKSIEEEHRMHCDIYAIIEFFYLHSKTLARDPGLIWNIYETMVASNNKFKVQTKVA